MAFTPQEHDRIREWLAFARIFQDADPQLEAAINAVQSQADGGTQPDNFTELRIRGYLTSLAALDVAIDSALGCSGTTKVGNIEKDAARQILMIERRQRVYIGRIADALSIKGYRDPTQAKESMPGGDYLARVSPRGAWP